VAEAAGKRLQYTGVVNLNQATAAELDVLPGVGEKAALRIIAWREKRPFRRVEELVRVKGFGRKTFLKLKPLLAVVGPTTLKAERVAGRGEPAPPPASGEVAAKH
jgi:competence protein ComEA